MTAARTLMVENYDVIRFPLKSIFVFGCYTAKQVKTVMGIDESTYKANVQRLASVLEKKYLRENKVKSSKILSIDYDRFDNIANLIISTFRIKRSTLKMMIVDITILQVLAMEDKSMKNMDLWTYFQEDVSRSTIYDRLEVLCKLGYVRNINGMYHINDDILAGISQESLHEFHQLMYLFRHILPISSLGHRVQEAVRGVCRDKCAVFQNDMFIFEDCFYWNMLDDEVLLTIMYAKEMGRGVSFYYHDPRFDISDKEVQSGFPYKVMINCNDYRQFLFLEQDGQLRVFRLDFISGIVMNDEAGTSGVHDIEACCSGFLPYDDMRTKKLVIDFCFDGADDLRERFFKEKGPGTIKKVADNKYVYEAELYDPIGLIPWIRSFGSHAVVRYSDEHTVRELIRDNWEDVINLYGKK